jgi:hypothetical protein
VLFDREGVPVMTERYGISHYLPGYSVLGLRGWDDFIVQDSRAAVFTMPTVPLIATALSPFEQSLLSSDLRSDERFTCKIKWYIKPIIFGGDPNPGENMTWIPIQDHQPAVKYWNGLYRDLKRQQKNA